MKFRATEDGYITALRFYKQQRQHRHRTSAISGRPAASSSPR